MLSLQVQQSGFLLNVSFFQVLSQFLNFSLSLLVQFNLGLSGTTSFMEPLTKVLIFSSQVRPLAFSLGPSLSFSFKFFFKLFNSALDLFDSLLGSGNNMLLPEPKRESKRSKAELIPLL